MNISRLDTYLFLKHKLGIKEGTNLPWWFIGVRFLFYPLLTVTYYLKEPIYFDSKHDTFDIRSLDKKITLEAIYMLLTNFNIKENEIITTKTIWRNIFVLRQNHRSLKSLIDKYALR